MIRLHTITRATALLVATTLTLAACGGTDTTVVETVDAATASNLITEPGTVLLDIRTPEEFAEVRIDGAINIDFYATDFADQIGALDRNTSYVVYCRSGNRSGQAMDLFRDLDFTQVHEVGNGIVSWIDAGLPTTSG